MRRYFFIDEDLDDLQTLEREVLGHTRQGDVDGALVPVLFFEYLRSGDFGPMELVMEHNRQDVASLVTLLCRLCHNFVTQHPAQAHEEGWSKHSWERD